MKVIALNGSPHKEGNTYAALMQIGKSLQEEDIDFEVVQIGINPIRGCMACNKCQKNKNEKCVIATDVLNDILQKIKNADGLVLASPVYYAGIAGTMKCFLDRAFYVSSANGNWFRHKVGAVVANVRRTGGSITFDGLNHYLSISEMIIASSTYWNVTHGTGKDDVLQDEEGIQTMTQLGKNMAWLLKMKDSTSQPEPSKGNKVYTNFIR